LRVVEGGRERWTGCVDLEWKRREVRAVRRNCIEQL
jgi:hypothetical protein